MSTKPQATTEGKGHEEKDIDVPSIALIAIGLVCLLLLVQLIVWMTMRHLQLKRAATDQGMVAPATAGNGALFPEPRLQVDPALDLAKMRARDLHDLTTYGWIDRKSDTVRIPIERAMQLIAERGLPEVGQKQTPLGLMQARPATKPAPKKRRTRY